MKKRLLLIPAMLLVAVALFTINKSGVLKNDGFVLPERYTAVSSSRTETPEYESFSEAGLTVSPSQFGEDYKNLLSAQHNDVKKLAPKEALQHSTASSYYLRVNYKANTVTVYIKDITGQYKIPVRAMVCSTGKDTPHKGIYKPKAKAPWGYLFGGVYGQYTTTILGDILSHSVPYTEFENPASLEWEEFDKLGEAASLGCIRLQVADAKWIYENASRIKGVEFYGKDDPGPLGKPEAMKISGYENERGWDPTDTNPENPWFILMNSVDK